MTEAALTGAALTGAALTGAALAAKALPDPVTHIVPAAATTTALRTRRDTSFDIREKPSETSEPGGFAGLAPHW
ncbi:hypothetical protein [Streptomyces cremeus]|uniref:Uncharacterized protein n=1 Tax=Streptomyces cremeus TaxID=66881 RepID=A0ABV5PJE7_STRCM